MTTLWFRSRLQQSRFSGNHIIRLHFLSKCSQCRCGYNLLRLWLNECRNPQFGCTILDISLMEVVGCLPPSQLRHFVKAHLLLPEPLHAVLNCFGDCAHHPARLIVFTQLPQHWILFIIVFVFPILPIVGPCIIAQTVSNRIQHLLECFFLLSGCQSHNLSRCHIILLLPNRWLCVFNSHSRHSGLSIHSILDGVLFLLIAQSVHFPSFFRAKHCFGSQAAQCF